MTDTNIKNNNEPQRKMLTITFGRGLVGEPFTSRAGTQLSEIKIPNEDPNDHSPWESFVVPTKFIRDSQFGKGVWIALPEDGMTRVSRGVIKGQDEQGRNIWGNVDRAVPNTELKEMLEAYKRKNREQTGSLLGDLAQRKEQAGSTPAKGGTDEELPFR